MEQNIHAAFYLPIPYNDMRSNGMNPCRWQNECARHEASGGFRCHWSKCVPCLGLEKPQTVPASNNQRLGQNSLIPEIAISLLPGAVMLRLRANTHLLPCVPAKYYLDENMDSSLILENVHRKQDRRAKRVTPPNTAPLLVPTREEKRDIAGHESRGA